MVAEPFYQGGAYVGYKTKDGATGYFACTLSTIGCRFSDALAAAYTPGLANDLGRIIGMQYPDQPDLSLAEQILPQYYGDYISSAPRDLSGDYIGATVFKVGARTGETHGTIVATAVDVRLNNGLGYLSQVAVAGTGTNNVADEGDSGAPVFERVGGAQLVGVLMGITGDRQRYYYSAWGNVTNELVGRPRAPFPYGAIQVMP
jgi:hypothetical protein